MITTLIGKWFNRKPDLIIEYLPNITNYLGTKKGEITIMRQKIFFTPGCLDTKNSGQLKKKIT